MATAAERTSAPRQRGAPETIVANSLTVFGSQLAIKIVSFAFNIIVIRHLGSDHYGKYAVCAAFSGLFAVLSDLGLAPYTVKHVARDHALLARLVSNVIAIRVTLALAVVALTSGLAFVVGYDSQIRLGIFIATLALISYAFFGAVDAGAMGLERFRFSASINVVLQITNLVLAGFLVFGGGGFLGLLLAPVIGTLLVALVALRRLGRSAPLRAPIELNTWPDLVRSSWPFAAITLALAVSYKADAVILSGFVSTALIGAYAAAYNLVFTAMTVSHSINLALYPTFIREYAASPERARALFRQTIRIVLFISLPIGVVVSLNARAIILFLYGSRFVDAAPALAILSWVIPLMFLSEFLGYIAIIVDRESLAARANWVSSVVNVAANLALIPFFGILAAAATTLLTEALLVLQYIPVARVTSLHSDAWRSYGRTVLAAAILAGVAWFFRAQQWPVLLIGMLAAAIYLLAAVAVGAVGREDARVLTDMLAARRQRVVTAEEP